MEHNRKQKLLMIIALVFGIASLSVGFAAFSVTLNISSSASVTPNSDTFSVKFSTSETSLSIGEIKPFTMLGATNITNGTIDNSTNPTVRGLSATFTSPRQYVDYVFYARNEGEYITYLNSVNFIGEVKCEAIGDATNSLVQDACTGISVSIEIADVVYKSTTSISNHQLSKGQSELIHVTLEYEMDAPMADGDFKVTFPDIALVYSTIDDPSIQPEKKVIKLESGNLNDPGSIVSIGDEKFYVIGQEDGNVKLLSMYNLLVGNSVEEDMPIPLSKPTGKQDSSARGYVDGEFLFIGTTEFSSISQKGATYSDYNGSIVEEYVENYEVYLISLGANISNARLISKTELEILGCVSAEESCSGAPSWVYSISYWSETPDESDIVWGVKSNASFYLGEYLSAVTFGVRPVIEIPLSEF